MDYLLVIIGILLIIGGIMGCFLPVIPGPPLSYLGILLLEFTSASPFSVEFMVISAVFVALVTVLDYVVPIWGTKKFGGSKYGNWGSMIGLLIGLFTGPWGVIIGPFLGAFVGELIGGKNSNDALKAGFGAFVGFLVGTGLKLGVSGALAFYFFKEVWIYFVNRFFQLSP